VFTPFSGSIIDAIVNMKRSVPAENDWTGAANGSWNTASNWLLSHSANSGETAGFVNPLLAGTVSLNHNQSAGSLWFDSGSPYTIASGSGGYTLTLSNTADIWIDAGVHTISAPLALSGSLTVDAEPVGVAASSVGLIVSGQISGNSALIKTGPGILYLNNTNNTYSGNTSITGGTLSAVGGGSLGASGSATIANATLDFSGSGTFTRSILLSGSGANSIQADAGVVTLSGAISGTGGLTKTGNGTLAVSNAGNSYSGATNVLAGTLQLQGAGALNSTPSVAITSGAMLDLNGLGPALANVAGSGAVTNGKLSSTATLSAAYAGGPASFAAPVQDGAGKVAVNVPSGGVLTLGNTANNYSGGTTISGGTLSVVADGNLGSGNGGIVLNNNGVLQAASGFTLNSGRTITLLGKSGVDVAAAQTLAFGGAVSGAGSLTKTGSGTLLLTGASNTFSGNATISGGNLAVAGDASLGNSGGTVIINGGVLEFTTDAASAHTLNLASAQSYVQVDAGTVTHNGLITGSGGLVKTGPGALSVTNPNNNFTGQTTVAAGTLVDNDPTGWALGSGTGTVQVLPGAQLAGTGVVSLPVECKGGGIAPGSNSAIGTLYLQQGLTLDNGSSVTFKLSSANGNAVSDCIDFGPNPYTYPSPPAAGLVTGGTCTANLTGTPVPVTGKPYVLFDHDEATVGGPPPTPSATNFKLNAPPGYVASWGVNDGGLDYSTYNEYYQLTATFSLNGSEWVSSGGTGAWNNSAKWSNNQVPTEVSSFHEGSAVLLGTKGAGTITLTPNDPNYVHILIFNNSNSSYTIAAPSSGTLSLTGVNLQGTDTGSSIVEVVSGSHTITAPVNVESVTDITGFDPAAALTMRGQVSGTGSLTLAGSGMLILACDNTYSGGTTVNGGTLALAANSSIPDGSSLTVGAGGTVMFDSTLAMASGQPRIAPVPAPSGDAVAAPVPEPDTLTLLAALVFCSVAACARKHIRRSRSHYRKVS
jgi:autotransporter-associated beta strand protein